MKLLFKQRFFSWFDSYDIYNEEGDTVYTVKGAPSWGPVSYTHLDVYKRQVVYSVSIYVSTVFC